MKKIKVIYAVWAILIILLIALLTYIGFSYKSKLSPYKDLENSLSEAAKKYVELKFLYPEDGEKLTINVDDIIKEGVIKNFSYNNKACSGYVELTYNGVYNYKSFIKCDKYETKGF